MRIHDKLQNGVLRKAHELIEVVPSKMEFWVNQ